jgi:hypothetical protein
MSSISCLVYTGRVAVPLTNFKVFSLAVSPLAPTLIAGLNQAWGWNLPIDAILATFMAVETFLGVVFLGSKIATDKRN